MSKHLEVKLLEGSQANWYPLIKTGDSQWKEFGGCSGIYISASKNLAFILNKASKNVANMARFPREPATMARRIPQGTVITWMMLDFLFRFIFKKQD